MRCRVLIVSLEDNADELRRRFRAACLHHKVEQTELDGWLFLASPGVGGGKLMALDPRGRPIVGALAAKLSRAIERHKIDIVSLDPFVKSHSVEENNNSMIDDVVGLLTDFTERYDMAVDTPHHVSKGASDPGNASRGRGASSAKDAMRLVNSLTTMSQSAGARRERG
jgi:RecA-family ATPase